MLSQLMHEWAYEVLELVDGDVDVHKFNNSSKTAEEDLHELFNQGKQQFEQLPSHNLHRDYTKHFLKGCFFRISLPTEGPLDALGGERLTMFWKSKSELRN